ncbi:glycosyltransferase family 2 protein [candidate division WWE3 bacterium]|nr:glycosyltransferase family 2 protein [candidate division WWE3 bacterium]
MKITFIVVNYNTKDLLVKCIINLLSIQPNLPKNEIVVVDNGSYDGSTEEISSLFSLQVTLIKNPQNSLSSGHNLGFMASSGEYIVHLGTDCFPTADAINSLINYMDEHSDVGISTGKVTLRDGSLDMDSHRGLVTPWVALTHLSGLDKLFPTSRLFSGYFLGYMDMSKPHGIDTCISHFMFIRRVAYLKVGLWDTAYIVYGEDLDFCFRMKQANYKIMYLPDVKILHYKGAGVGRKTTSDLVNASRSDKKHLFKIRQETTRAMKIFYKTHLAKNYPFFINWLVYLLIFMLAKTRELMYLVRGSGY